MWPFSELPEASSRKKKVGKAEKNAGKADNHHQKPGKVTKTGCKN
jgi:hypothetical protein